MEQTVLAIVNDTPDVLKARLKREWEAIAARKQAGEMDYDIQRARTLTIYLDLGLTQYQIAECVDISRGWLDQILRYGRFMNFLPADAGKILEGQFRRYWKETADHDYLFLLRGKKNVSVRLAYEQDVFQKIVEKYMKGEDNAPDQRRAKNLARRQLTKKILAQFSDGKFHLLRDIATAVEGDMELVREICHDIVRDGTYQTFGESRSASPAQGSFTYRFVKGGKKKIDVAVFLAEVKPVLDDFENVINGHSVDFSQQAMKLAFAQFRKGIDRVVR